MPTQLAKSDLILSKPLPADRHPATVYLSSLPSRGSVPAQRSALNKIAQIIGTDVRSLNWGALRYQHVEYIRARLMERYSPATANRLLTALRRVLRAAWKLGQMPNGEYRKVADVERVHASKDDTEADLTGRALSIGELTAILGACSEDETPAGGRDAAIIGLGYGLGLRRSEISKLDLEHFDREAKVIHVRGGKGNKSRTVPIDDGALDALRDWLRIRGEAPGLVFWGIHKGGEFQSHRLNVKAVDELYKKRTRQASVKSTNFHDLRRTFISDLLDKGVDLATVAKLAGHSDPRTTARYDRRKMETRRRAIATLHVPYTKRSK